MNPPKTQALAEGPLGVALLHIERGNLAAARPLLAEAVDGGVSSGANACLFHGAPALEFVLGRAGRIDRDLQAAVDHVVAVRLAAARQRRESQRLPSLSEFELIRGLTGLGVVLLARPRSLPLLEEVLAHLVSLARPVKARDRAMPGWWSPDSPTHEQMDGGHGNNGMAHGIAGPLALLSLAARRGIHVEGQSEAIEVYADWLERFSAFYWITLGQLGNDGPPLVAALRPSWCYGDLGIARALQLAGLALCNPVRRKTAEKIAQAALADPARVSQVADASLCHGWAGMLTTTTAIAADSAAPDQFTVSVRHIHRRLAAGVAALPKPGFMEGRAGAQLALEGSNITGWTSALLLD
ncbi:lanthionine synthetase C family protein [Nonomuraea sediminis]|uniref:lanthionine synthetase C family protein n=1 Tax=Nonomuraea sediminis TaxID=2835864 RepID=UPI001BDC456A|nr:lanthionine synthetase C family protein [Nonomuraea sediminis]